MQDWIVDVVRSMGPLGVGLLMLLENLFPPIPSELIMPLAGFLSTRGGIHFGAALAAGIAGSVAGALVWYEIGRRVGRERFRRWIEAHGVWLTMRPEDVDRAAEWFGRHGRKGVLMARLLPMVRTLISVPAGISGMPLMPFLFYTAIGTALWTAALAWAGRVLGSQFHEVDRYVGPVSWVIIVVAVLIYLMRIIQFHWRRGAG